VADQRDGGIAWTDETWNPIRGCSRVSPGCENCYAERVAARFSGKGQPYEGLAEMHNGKPRWTRKARLVPEKLAEPLRWKRARRIFVNSTSDLFHETLSVEDIARIWAVMLLAPHHTYQVLTKRPHFMRATLTNPSFYQRVLRAAEPLRARWPELTGIGISDPTNFPAKWIWLGVSVEDQQRADERIPLLLNTPAAVRFISAEPLLGPVDLGALMTRSVPFPPPTRGRRFVSLDWVIAGAESGPGARAMSEDWVRSLRDQCAEAGVSFFLKQFATATGKKISLPVLDGKQHAEFPS
jgi:protein gp37